MLGLFMELEKKTTDEVRTLNSVLLDTSFLIHVFQERHQARLDLLMRDYCVCISSFNMLEFDHVKHHIDESVRIAIRHWLNKKPDLLVVDIGIHPGDRQGEISFVHNIDGEILKLVSDPSDAVLAACAVASNSHVLTRDKHHLFTTKLNTYMQKRGLKVFNHIPEMIKDEKNH